MYERYSCLEILGPVWAMSRVSNFQPANAGGGGGTPLKGLNGDVRPARVCFSGFLY